MERKFSEVQGAVKRRSLAEEVVEALTAQVRQGLLKPGDKLPTESALMLTHGVSRTVVREAISRLQAAGLAESRHGVGTFVLAPAALSGLQLGAVSTLGIEDQRALIELRLGLEVEMSGLAAQRRSLVQLQALRAILDGARGEQHGFYALIARATGNRYLIDVVEQLAVADEAPGPRPTWEREEIYQAIARQDPDAARAAMRLHLINQRERLRA